MASQKQIDANRRNAQRSTGPRSSAGKARSRLNALRDGLTGQITTLSDADRSVFEQLKTEMLADFDPKTTMERKLAAAIAWDTWRLDHLRAIEMNVYALGIEEDTEDAEDNRHPDEFDAALADARTFRAEAPRFDLMSLYEQRMSRNLHRNLAVLRDLQAERKRNYDRDRKDEVLLARFNEVNDVPIQASTSPSRNGFIFSDQEIAVAAVRQRYLETASLRMTNTPHAILYGDLLYGSTDTFLLKVDETTPALERARAKIHGVSPESIAMRRLTNPEEFGLHER